MLNRSPGIFNISASLAMSTSVLKALLGKLDIKTLTVHIMNDFRNEKLFPELLCFAFKCTIKVGQPVQTPSQRVNCKTKKDTENHHITLA